MKKTVLFLVLALVIGGMVFAQTAAPTTTVNGTLGLNAGRLVLKSGTMTYYTRGLERYIGFIDGLKDGAQVAIEGYVAAPVLEGQTEKMLYPVKLTINGKVYEVGTTMTASAGLGNWSGGHRMGKGRW